MRRIYWYLGAGTIAICVVLIAAVIVNNYKPNLGISMASAGVQNLKRKDVHIIFNTIPKSASLYVSKVLAVSLHSERIHISPGHFPHDHLLYSEMERFYQLKNAIAKPHIDASPFNQQMLKKFTDRIVVQFRDPREVLLSWIHYIQRIHDEGKTKYLYHFSPTPAEEYYSWSIDKQVDWNIEHFLPGAIVWMQEWLQFKEQEDLKPNGFKVLLTTYDDFKKDEKAFFMKILSFYDIPEEQFNFIHLRLDMDVHFRKGDQNEWRHVYTQEQIRRINKISQPILVRFNW